MYEDEYQEQPRRPRRRISLHWILLTAAVLVIVVLRIASGLKSGHRASQEVRVETVTVVDWKAVDGSLQRCLEHAHDKAERYAEGEVQAWVKELRIRVDEDFIPWWFGYFNQQAVMLKAAGYWCLDTPLIEGLAGKQESMEDRLEALVEREFHARVLQPRSAQLRMEKITRKTIEVYLVAVQDELDRVRVVYQVHPQEWERYLDGLPGTVLTLQANRQVPVMIKGVTAGSGAAALVIGRSLTGRVKALVVRRLNQEFLEHGAMVGGRAVSRYAGWWIAAICAGWDLADHHRTVQQNRPVLERSLGVYLDELQDQVLRDQRCGVLTVLGEVQHEVMGEVSHE